MSTTCDRIIQYKTGLANKKKLTVNDTGIFGAFWCCIEAEAADLLMFSVCELPCAVTLSPSASVSHDTPSASQQRIFIHCQY